MVRNTIRNHPAYLQVLEAVQGDPRVTDALGQPVSEAGWLPLVRPVGGGDLVRGPVQFQFEVAGPKGRARVLAGVQMVDDRWQINQLEVQPQGGSPIVLVGHAAAAGETAPEP
jgi:hypothetical protein